MDKQEYIFGFNKPIAGSQIKMDTATGFGSVLTNIRIFTNIYDSSRGDMSVVSSAANGTSVIIRAPGLYAVKYLDSFAGSTYYGITKNETGTLTASAAKNVIAATQNAAGLAEHCSGTEWLDAGDVIRCNSAGGGIDTASRVMFTIARVA